MGRSICFLGVQQPQGVSASSMHSRSGPQPNRCARASNQPPPPPHPLLSAGATAAKAALSSPNSPSSRLGLALALTVGGGRPRLNLCDSVELAQRPRDVKGERAARPNHVARLVCEQRKTAGELGAIPAITNEG